jgi:hypothetical protein
MPPKKLPKRMSRPEPSTSSDSEQTAEEIISTFVQGFNLQTPNTIAQQNFATLLQNLDMRQSSIDLEKLRADIKADIRVDLEQFRAEIKADIRVDLEQFRADIKADIKAEFEQFRAEIRANNVVLQRAIENLERRTTFEFQTNQRVKADHDTIYLLPLPNGELIDGFPRNFLHLCSFKILPEDDINNLLRIYAISTSDADDLTLKRRKLAHYLGINPTIIL